MIMTNLNNTVNANLNNESNANLLPQDVYRLTSQGVIEMTWELDTYESDTIRVGAMCAVCDEWCLEIIDIEEDGTVVVHDIHNFLNETYASTEYLAMVKHEAHLVELYVAPMITPIPSMVDDEEGFYPIPFCNNEEQDCDALSIEHNYIEGELKRIREELKELREYVKLGDLPDWEYNEISKHAIALETERLQLTIGGEFVGNPFDDIHLKALSTEVTYHSDDEEHDLPF